MSGNSRTNTRSEIAGYIRSHPGIHFNELVRSLDLAPGQVQYHVRLLVSSDEFVVEKLYGRSHYYTPEFDAWERSALALFRRETDREILAHLLEDHPRRAAALAEELDIARSTLEWHLDHLLEQDIVEKRRDSRNRVEVVLTHPEDTERLLATVTPSLPDRFVDRFTLLVDELLSDR